MKKIIALALCICMCLSIVACGSDNALDVERITDMSIVRELEASVSNEYANAQEKLREYISEEVGVLPDKIVFTFIPGDLGYAWVHVYYKNANNWYAFSHNWLELIPSDLEEELLRAYTDMYYYLD